ncbi:MAG: GspE/PulE family protein [Anaerovibrio sp.]|uniref:GspE/PulE family protein n=1 Tax=Anaerovibrio sp. TaxID=1872532 RepID=UPI0025DA3BCA|nr:GspE/PulE family protein [Anaerovibrio sp.]MCR5177037.1 GspE/PulE family protein [Anaerovibrio sp.]
MELKNNNDGLEQLFSAAHRSTGNGINREQRGIKGSVGSPVVELVDKLVQDALLRDASDIHIEPGNTCGRVRYRINGLLEIVFRNINPELYSHIISRIKIMGRMNIAETRLPQDGRFSYEYKGQEIDVRISVVPLIVGEKAVLRLLNRGSRFMEVTGLGLSPENEKVFMDLCRDGIGGVIFAGPVNSGKTTALYAALYLLNNTAKNIVTIEDPVEYRLQGINQIQVNSKIKLDFEEALEAVLRQDYDALAIGEVRNSNVANILIKSSLAGHLVFATIHTSRAVKVIYRLLNMGIEPYYLAAALRGIIAQRLVPRLCQYCRKSYIVEPESEIADFLGDDYHEGLILYRKHGCERCGGRGIDGRIAIHEILRFSRALRECIGSDPHADEMQKAIADSGMITMERDGFLKATKGLVEIEEIMKLDNG